LRLKTPAEALDEVAIAHPTIAKAITNRRILKSPMIKKGYTTSRVINSMAAFSMMRADLSNSRGGLRCRRVIRPIKFPYNSRIGNPSGKVYRIVSVTHVIFYPACRI
jgi:hypothetical protein